MKTLVTLISALFLSTAFASAQRFGIGGHGAYMFGGDVEAESGAYGLQAQVGLLDWLSCELSGTMGTEEYTITGQRLAWANADLQIDPARVRPVMIDADITHIALTARASWPLGHGLKIYGGGGASYNQVDVNMPPAAQLVSAVGPAIDNVRTFLKYGGDVNGTVHLEVDDTIGYHACGGVSWMLTDMLELFAEYRFNWLEFDISGSASVEAEWAGITFIDRDVARAGTLDYSFGLARVGVNVVL